MIDLLISAAVGGIVAVALFIALLLIPMNKSGHSGITQHHHCPRCLKPCFCNNPFGSHSDCPDFGRIQT